MGTAFTDRELKNTQSAFAHHKFNETYLSQNWFAGEGAGNYNRPPPSCSRSVCKPSRIFGFRNSIFPSMNLPAPPMIATLQPPFLHKNKVVTTMNSHLASQPTMSGSKQLGTALCVISLPVLNSLLSLLVIG